MGGMRFQPQGLSRIRGDLLGRVVGANFTNNRQEIGGSGAEVSLIGNPELIVGPGSTLARRFVASSSQYATITPPEGMVDFSLVEPYAIVCVLAPQTLGVATRILSYRHAASATGIQLGFTTSNRLGYWHGSSSGSGTVRAANASTLLEEGKACTVVFGWDGGHFMYIDGVSQNGPNVATFVTSNTGTTADINIGRRNTGSSYFDGSVPLFAHIRGSVDGAALSLNPWQIFEEQDDYLVSSAAVVEAAKLSGAVALQVSAAGTLSTSVRLAGSAAAQVSAAGMLTTAVRLAGAATMRASAAGALAGAGAALAGAAALRMSAAGAISSAIRLVGAAAARVSAAGTLGSAQVPIEVVDISTISPARITVFGGSGSRVVPFGGSGSRITPFEGSGSRVTPFEGSGSRVTEFE